MSSSLQLLAALFKPFLSHAGFYGYYFEMWPSPPETYFYSVPKPLYINELEGYSSTDY